MRHSRLYLAIALAAAVAPATWLRSDPEPRPADPDITIQALAHESVRAGPFVLEGVWQFTSADRLFGGFSALTALSQGRFLAGSDNGNFLTFQRPDVEGGEAVFGSLGLKAEAHKSLADLESLTRDHETGTLWAGYEGRNAIVRFGRDLTVQGEVRPEPMRGWGYNSGPEALARLDDGRFLVLEESSLGFGSRDHRAVLFSGDPLEDTAPASLTMTMPDAYRPVDMAATGDGQILLLLRKVRFGLPPQFESAIASFHQEELAAGRTVTPRLLVKLEAGIPADNYEGIATTFDGEAQHVWIISDDNLMQYQRTLLLKMRWAERQKARE